GLNLTFERLEGLVKHRAYDEMPKVPRPALCRLQGEEGNLTTGTGRIRVAAATRPEVHSALEKYHCPSLEAQIADLADEITYYSHDLDDAVDFEILSAERLEENEVWRHSRRAVLARYPEACA